jgi:2-hydroxycyclohexanecarboxyl-CoA dehydrogenase
MAVHGITVNAVSPGVVDTDLLAGATDDESEALAAAVPLGGRPTVEDIAPLFVWPSSKDSATSPVAPTTSTVVPTPADPRAWCRPV